jgi:hypothetical protein
MRILISIVLLPFVLCAVVFKKIAGLFGGGGKSQWETFEHPKGYYSCLVPKGFVDYPPELEGINISHGGGDFKSFINIGDHANINIAVFPEPVNKNDLDELMVVMCRAAVASYDSVKSFYAKDENIDGQPAKITKLSYINNGEEYYFIGILTLTSNLHPINIVIKCLATFYLAYIDTLASCFIHNFKIKNKQE